MALFVFDGSASDHISMLMPTTIMPQPFGNMPYSLANFNRFLVVFRVEHGENLRANDMITKDGIMDLLDCSSSQYHQDKEFNEGMGLVEKDEEAPKETLRITEEGIRYLELGDWANRQAVKDDCMKEMFQFTKERLSNYSGRVQCGAAKSIMQQNFGLNTEQREYLLRRILHDVTIDGPQLPKGELPRAPVNLLRFAIQYYMRFIHLEPEHWSPKSNEAAHPEEFTDVRIDLFYDIFDIEDQRKSTPKVDGRYPPRLMRNIRGTLEWCAGYCEDLGLVMLKGKGNHDTASFTERGNLVYQLLETREIYSKSGFFVCNGPWKNWNASVDIANNEDDPDLTWGSTRLADVEKLRIGDVIFFSNSNEDLGPFTNKVIFGWGYVTRESFQSTVPRWPDEVEQAKVIWNNQFQFRPMFLTNEDGEAVIWNMISHHYKKRLQDGTFRPLEPHRINHTKGVSSISDKYNLWQLFERIGGSGRPFLIDSRYVFSFPQNFAQRSSPNFGHLYKNEVEMVIKI